MYYRCIFQSMFLLGHSDLVQLFLYSGFNPELKDKVGQVKNKFYVNIC